MSLAEHCGRMTHEQLIAKAKEHAADFERGGGNDLSVRDLPIVRVREAAVVYFESDHHQGRVEVLLDRESGAFISATTVPHDTR